MSMNENVESHKWDINNPILSTLFPHFFSSSSLFYLVINKREEVNKLTGAKSNQNFKLLLVYKINVEK